MTTPENPPGQPSYVVPPLGSAPDGPAPLAAPEPVAASPGDGPASSARGGLGTYAALAAAGLVIGAAGTWAVGAVSSDAVASTVDRSSGQQGGVGVPGHRDQGAGQGWGQSSGGQSNGMVPPGTSSGDQGTSGAAGGSGSSSGSSGGQGWGQPGASGGQQDGSAAQGGMAPPSGAFGPGGGQGPMGTSGGS